MVIVKRNQELSSTGRNRLLPKWLLFACVVAIAAIVWGGFQIHRWQHDHWETVIREDLEAVASLKVNTIARWRAERLGDGQSISGNCQVAAAVSHWLETGDKKTEEQLLRTMQTYRRSYGYVNVFLVDVTGKVILGDYPIGSQLVTDGMRALGRCRETGEAVLTDLHTGKVTPQPHLDVVAPISCAKDGQRKVIGAILLTVDAAEYLWPLIQTWPTQSETAETLLVRRDGEDVLFLNELRFKKNAPLRFRVPLSSNIPAARGLRGERGVVQDRDYRGQPVISAIVPVPNSNWLMVSKMDTSEAFSRIHEQTLLIVATATGLLVAVILVTMVLWQRMESRHLRLARDAEASRLALMRHFEYLIKYANDIILLAEEGNHRIVEANDRAIEAYGYTLEELRMKKLPELIAPSEVGKYGQRVDHVSSGRPLLCESVHLRKDGTTFPVEVSARLISFEGHRSAQLIIRDISERKQAEAEQHHLERRLASIFEQSPMSMWISDEKGVMLRQNQACRDTLHIADDEVVGTYCILEDPIIRDAGLMPVVQRVFEHGEIARFSIEYDVAWVKKPRPSGPMVLYLDVTISPIKNENGVVTNTVIQHLDMTEKHHAEAEQKRVERTLESVFEQAPLSMWFSDESGVMLRQNQACRDLLQITDTDVVGKYNLFNDAITQAAGLVPLIEKVFREGVAVRFPLTYDIASLKTPRSETPEIVYLDVTIAPIKDEAGHVTNAVVQHIDVTAKTLIEAEQHRLERQLASIFEQSSLSMWLADANGVCVRQNQACRNLFNIPDEEVCGKYCLFDDPACIEAGIVDTIRRVYSEGEIARFQMAYDVAKIRPHLTEPMVLYLDVTISPIKNELGHVVNAIVQHMNLTGKMVAEENQRRTERVLATIFEQSPLAMWISDAKGNFVRQNQACRDLMHVDDADLLGKYNIFADPMCIANDAIPQIERVFRDGVVETFPITYDLSMLPPAKPAAPRFVHLEATVAPIKDEHGQIVNVVVLIVNATDRKHAEAEQRRAEQALRQLNAELEQRVSERTAQLQAANKELESFAYSVSHDLRTPLRSLDGFSMALLEEYSDRLDDVGKDYLTRIRVAAQRMAKLIDDLLRLSRLTRTNMNITSVDLSRVAEEIVEELRRNSPERSVTVTIQPEIRAMCDADLIHIAMTNLLHNAWKFTGKSSQATIEFSAYEENSQTIYTVRDNGAGFDMAYSEKLFGVFQRLHGTQEFPGTGVGLATVHRIIARHGGRIWAQAAMDCGATFFFTLPDHSVSQPRPERRD